MLELVMNAGRRLAVGICILMSSSAALAVDTKLLKFWDDSEPNSVMSVKHQPWQEILDVYVDDQHPSGINRFNYRAVTPADITKLSDYLAYLQLLEPRQFNSLEAKAYWINLYNALMVNEVIEAVQEDEIESIKKLGNRYWRRDRANVVMQDISLDSIQHGILRPIWKDPRVNYAITTGALGGGNLQKTAYSADNIEELLAKAEKEYLNHDRAMRLAGDRAVISSVFDWYLEDFVGSERNIVRYISQRLDEQKKAQFVGINRVKYEYDWTVNSFEAVQE